MSTAPAQEAYGLAGLFSGTNTNVTFPLVITTIVVLLGLVLLALVNPRVGPREPPLLKPRIPFIGHMIGLLRHQAGYYSML